MRTVAYVITLAVLVGCAGRFERQMTDGLNQFVGKDIHVAIAKLGYPAAEQRIAGDHLYRWGVSGGSTALTSAAAGIAVTQVSPSGCVIDLVVNDANVVTRVSWSGQRRPCSAFEDRLEE